MATGAMGFYQYDGRTDPIDPRLANVQQRSERMADQRRADVNRPATPSTVLSQRQVAAQNPNPAPTAFAQAISQNNSGSAMGALNFARPTSTPTTTPAENTDRQFGQQWDWLRQFAPRELPTTDLVPGYTPEQMASARTPAPAARTPSAARPSNAAPAPAATPTPSALPRNGVTRADGTFIGVGDVGPANVTDFDGTTQAMREALAIRQQAIDSMNGGGRGGLAGLQSMLREINARPVADTVVIDGQTVPRNARNMRQEMADRQSTIDNTIRGYFGLENQALTNEGAMARTLAQGRNALDRIAAADATNYTPEALVTQRIASLNEGLQNIMSNEDLDPATRDEMARGYRAFMDTQLEQLKSYLLDDGNSGALGALLGAEPEGYAEGGMVRGAGYGGTPQMPAVMDEVTRYQRYVTGAKSMGLPVVPFEKFLAVGDGGRAGAGSPQGALAFAQGGMVPGDGDPRGVDGKVVMDMDPNAPTDSIPAMIDGQRPAKLDSGEFVMPADVVLHFGTDKLNKMIDAARQQKGASQKE